MSVLHSDQPDQPSLRPWIGLHTVFDVEAWIDNYNRDLQRTVGKTAPMANPKGQGICFHLDHGGEIYLHTSPEGEVLLDVTPEAEWVAPLIVAATGAASPVGRIWRLEPDLLTQLILGLSPLIASTRIVLEHDFGLRR